MAQHMDSRQQSQNQTGMNQSGDQGMLNHRQGGYGGNTNDNLSQDSQGQQFGSGPQQSSIGGQNQMDPTQRSQGSFTGQPVQAQGNMDTQGGQSIGQRGDSLQGAGQQNESVEQARTGVGR
jgi:hypothetical protein